MKNKMTIKELLDYGYRYQSKNDVKLLLSSLLNINQLELNLHLEETIDDEVQEDYIDEEKAI